MTGKIHEELRHSWSGQGTGINDWVTRLAKQKALTHQITLKAFTWPKDAEPEKVGL